MLSIGAHGIPGEHRLGVGPSVGGQVIPEGGVVEQSAEGGVEVGYSGVPEPAAAVLAVLAQRQAPTIDQRGGADEECLGHDKAETFVR